MQLLVTIFWKRSQGLILVCLNPYAAGGYFGQCKIMHKSWKMIETLAHGYSSKGTRGGLSNEYKHDRV